MKHGIIEQNQQANAEPVSAEEQARYDLIVKDAIAQLYGEGKFEPLVETLAEAVKLDLPEIMANIVNTVIAAMEKKHGDISDDILIGLGEELIEQLSDIISAAGIKELSDDEIIDTFTKAVYKYMDSNREKIEEIDQGELEKMAGEAGLTDEINRMKAEQQAEQPQEAIQNG